METIDWQGSRNALRAAMEESVENALGISTYTRNALFARKDDPDPGFGVIFAETDEKYNVLLQSMGIKEGADSTQTGYTKNVEKVYEDMAVKLNHFDDLVRPIFAYGTLEYNTIWGPNRNRFYRGSYEQRENAVQGMAKAMNQYPALAAVEVKVLEYYNVLKTARESQQGLISGAKTYGREVFVAIEDLILQLDRDLGWLKFYYALQDDAQGKVNAFFDLSKIINHNNNKVYPCHIPIDGNVRVCLHTFKETDRIKIMADGSEDFYLFLVVDSKWNLDPQKGYRVTAGTIIEKPVKEIFPDLTYRQVMALNSSNVKPTHFVFEIIEA